MLWFLLEGKQIVWYGSVCVWAFSMDNPLDIVHNVASVNNNFRFVDDTNRRHKKTNVLRILKCGVW